MYVAAKSTDKSFKKKNYSRKPFMDREYSVLNHPKQAIMGTHYLFCVILRQLSMLCFPAIFKPTAPLSLTAGMGFSVGIMDMQIGLNVSTRPSKGKYLHSHLKR